MKVAITNQAGGTPGLRCQRLSDHKWLDPDTKEWRATVPVKLFLGQIVQGFFDPAETTGTTLGSTAYILFDYVADLPIDDQPGAYWVDARTTVENGNRRIGQPQIVTIQPPLTLTGSLNLPVVFRS